VERTDISVILATNDGATVMPVALAHLEDQTFPSARYEVIVAAYGPLAGRAGNLERQAEGSPARIRVIQAPTEFRCGAFNAAAREARGHWLLFLDEELVAGSHLLEYHVAAQERHGGETAVVGGILLHPHAPDQLYTKWGVLDRSAKGPSGRPINALFWRIHNLSMPRRAFLDEGGFDEAYGHGPLYDIDLAWRLARKGMKGFRQPKASAYAVRAPGPEVHETNAYWEGRALQRLLEHTASDEVLKHFPARRSFVRYAMGEMTLPAKAALCRWVAPHTRAYVRLLPSVSRQRFAEGYRDARRGLPARAIAANEDGRALTPFREQPQPER